MISAHIFGDIEPELSFRIFPPFEVAILRTSLADKNSLNIAFDIFHRNSISLNKSGELIMMLSVPIPTQQPDFNILGTFGKPVFKVAFERGHTTIPIPCRATSEIS